MSGDRSRLVDASVAVKWVVKETGSDMARLLSQARLSAPDLLAVECANILWKKVRIAGSDLLQAQDDVMVLKPALSVVTKVIVIAL